MWLVIKYTLIGKIGAFFVGSAPVLFAIEIGNHINALIAAIPPTAAVIIGVIALKKGQKTLQVNIDGRMEQLLKATAEAAQAKGKENERVEARDRREEIKTEILIQKPEEISITKPGVVDVNVVNTIEDPVQSEITNPSDKPVNTLEQRQAKIDKAQEKLDKEIEKT